MKNQFANLLIIIFFILTGQQLTKEFILPYGFDVNEFIGFSSHLNIFCQNPTIKLNKIFDSFNFFVIVDVAYTLPDAFVDNVVCKSF